MLGFVHRRTKQVVPVAMSYAALPSEDVVEGDAAWGFIRLFGPAVVALTAVAPITAFLHVIFAIRQTLSRGL